MMVLTFLWLSTTDSKWEVKKGPPPPLTFFHGWESTKQVIRMTLLVYKYHNLTNNAMTKTLVNIFMNTDFNLRLWVQFAILLYVCSLSVTRLISSTLYPIMQVSSNNYFPKVTRTNYWNEHGMEKPFHSINKTRLNFQIRMQIKTRVPLIE